MRALPRYLLSTLAAVWLVHVLLRTAPGDSSGCGDLHAAISFTQWLSSVVTDGFGRPCYGPEGSVLELVGWALLRTLGLIAVAAGIAWGLAVLVAGWCLRRRSLVGSLALGALSGAGGVPAFLLAYWVASLMNQAFAGCQASAQCPGWFPLQAHDSWLRAGVGALVLAVGSGTLLDLSRDIALEVERVQRRDWVVFARSAGLSTWSVLGRALCLPLAGSLLAKVSTLFTEVVVVESVLGLRGLGTVTWEAARFRDMRVLLAASCVWAISLACVRLVVERWRPS